MKARGGSGSYTKGIPGRLGRREKAPLLRCQVCRSRRLRPGLDLELQPVGDLILSDADLHRPETFYPMRLVHCEECGLTQLDHVVNPKVVYKFFPFVSGTTKTATEHLQSLPRDLVARLKLGRRSFAIDIGSNDGTLLEAYRPSGTRFLGIDPSGDPVRLANERGIETLHAFFDRKTARYLLRRYGPADAITACGCFAHIKDLAGVMEGVKLLLKPRGIFATDSQYWLDMVEHGHYDNVFHQHLRYYAMRSLLRLHRLYEMDVFDVERSEVYGGSIRVFAGHAGAFPISDRVRRLLDEEEQKALYDAATTDRFARDIEARRDRLFRDVAERAVRGQKVIGLGAPAKASTVCNYCRLDRHLLHYITEINPLRIGKVLPGVHIPIVEEERMFRDPRPPDAAILFAWNYYEEVVPKLRARGFRGEVLLP